MLYKILADSVVFIHLLWIVFLLFGALAGMRNRKVRIAHISGLVFAIILQLFDWYCPLTHLETWLRTRHDPSLSYAGSFIIHYVEKLVYIDLSQTLIFVLSLFLCGFNAWIYLRHREE